jgi:hypothetical protein
MLRPSAGSRDEDAHASSFGPLGMRGLSMRSAAGISTGSNLGKQLESLVSVQ